jgi:hypothetical protein
MKFSNFYLIRTEGESPITWVYIAEVDVETGCFFWKKKARREIRRKHAGDWFFVDTGEFCPSLQIEALARAWNAQTGQPCKRKI